MAVWDLNVKTTDPLVVTAGSALSKSSRGKSRELWATSGTHVCLNNASSPWIGGEKFLLEAGGVLQTRAKKVLLHGIRAGRRAAGAPICWEASRGRRAGRSAADANSVEKHFSCCATARGACVAVPLIDPVIRRFSGWYFYPGLYFRSQMVSGAVRVRSR